VVTEKSRVRNGVFVRYDGEHGAKLTSLDDLELEIDETGEEPQPPQAGP
jgi:hypothetical protein